MTSHVQRFNGECMLNILMMDGYDRSDRQLGSGYYEGSAEQGHWNVLISLFVTLLQILIKGMLAINNQFMRFISRVVVAREKALN